MKVKLLVVDDSLFIRTFISRILADDPWIEVVGTATNGMDGVRMVKELRPHVVTMDIEMPKLNGIDALRQIMRTCPTPVIMLSSLTTEGADATITALSEGAYDFITKPATSNIAVMSALKTRLLQSIHAAASASVKPIQRVAVVPKRTGGAELSRQPSAPSGTASHLVAIGTSTGGPRALESVLTGLPGHFPAPIFVVQHMPPSFTRSLADRLNQLCAIQVCEAETGMIPQSGVAYVAKGGLHMEVLRKGRHLEIQLSDGPKRNEHRPSVDVLFESIADLATYRRHLVLMTGMGNDGARGMHTARQRGAETTVAESAETAVVFGMPKAAIDLGCVDHVVPLPQISSQLVKAVQLTQSSL